MAAEQTEQKVEEKRKQEHGGRALSETLKENTAGRNREQGGSPRAGRSSLLKPPIGAMCAYGAHESQPCTRRSPGGSSPA